MEQAYLDLGRKLLEEGHRKEDRTGTGTLSLFETKCGLICKRVSFVNNETEYLLA